MISIRKLTFVFPIHISAFTKMGGIVRVIENSPNILKKLTAPTHFSPYVIAMTSYAPTIIQPENKKVKKLTV